MPRRDAIPTGFKEAVYYLNLDHTEIVSVRKISFEGPTFDIHLRSGEKEWHGHLKARPYNGTVPARLTIDDLIAGTMRCPTCHGSGSVPRQDIG